MNVFLMGKRLKKIQMKPIKLLLSLCAMLVVTVGAWAQSSTTAPATPPAAVCGGSSTGTQTVTLTLGGSCTSAQLRLDILSSTGSAIASGTIISGVNGPNILPAATFPNVSGNYSLQATIVSTAPTGCSAGAITNGNTPQFPVNVSPSAPTLTGTAIPDACQGAAAPTNLNQDGLYATCNGVGTLTATGYNTTTATSPTRNVTFRCTSGGCQSPTTTLSYKVNALPAAPSANGGTLEQACVGVIPTKVLVGATPVTCATGTSLIIVKAGFVAPTAADFSATASNVQLYYACKDNTTGCIGQDYPAAPYTPTATPATPIATNAFIAAYSTFPTQVSTPASPNNAAQVCSDAGAKVINFSTTACAGTTAVVYDAATGGTALWASAAITIGGTAVPTAPITAPSTSTDYYIACNSGSPAFCEGGRYKLAYTVVAKPGNPIVSDIPTVCEGTTLSASQLRALATCATGTVTLTGAHSGTYLSGSNGVVTASSGVTPTFACVLNGCSSGLVAKGYTITPRPAAPTAVTLLDNVCEVGNTGSGMIGIKTHDCPVGSSPFVTSTLTGSTKLGLNGALFSQPTGSTIYTAYCQNDAGCVSPAGPAVTGVVTAKPITPFNLSLSSTGAACPSAVTSFNVIATCTGATAEDLHVFTTAAGGSSIISAPAIAMSSTTIAITGANKPTATTTYYVECKSSTGCISDRVMVGTYTVGAGLEAASATLQSSEICAVAAGNVKLKFTSNTCPTGSNLKVYQAATGNAIWALNASMEIDVPGALADAGNKNVYVVCRTTSGGCESETRTAIPYKINPYAAPTGTPVYTRQCVNTLPVVSGATCPAGTEVMLVVETAAGSNIAIEAQASDFPGGAKSVRVACRNTTTGCFTPWAATSFPSAGDSYTPVPTPAAPTAPLIGAYKHTGMDLSVGTPTRVSQDAAFASPAIVCSADGATVLHFAATCAGVNTAVVYDAATGGSAVWASKAIKIGGVDVAAVGTVGITPPTATKDYYIACNSGASGYCESTTRVKVTYQVVTNPDAPVASAPAIACSGTTVTFTATCTTGSLFRYNNAALTTGEATGAAALTMTAPTVLDGTAPVEVTRYFVCRTTTGACTSTATPVKYTTSARPAAASNGPAPVTITASNSCDGMATITSHNCAVGNAYFASTSNTGAPVLGLNGAAFSAGTATVQLYVFCRNAAGCLSDPTPVTFTPIAKPIAPANISLDKTSASCPTTVTNFKITATCTGAGSDELVVYTAASGGTALKKEPVLAGTSFTEVTIGAAIKPTETTTYYVACESATGCKSDRVLAGTYTVGPAAAGATITLKESTVCAGTQLEIASSTCPAGGTLTIYRAATGTDVWTVTAGKIQAGASNAGKVGDQKLYVTCTVDGCESGTRTEVAYKVKPLAGPAIYNGPATATVCSGTEISMAIEGCVATDTKVNFYSVSTLGALTLVTSLPTVSTPTSGTPIIGATYKVVATNTTGAAVTTTYVAKCSNETCESDPASASFAVEVRPAIATPTAMLSPSLVCGNAGPQTLLHNASCGTLQTVWFDATTNAALASMPTVSTNLPGTYSYYAKCRGAAGCLSSASNTVSYTVTAALTAPSITSSAAGVVCAGTPVTFTSNCPAGSTTVWSTGATGATLTLTQGSAGTQSVSAKCTISTCESPMSASVSASWSNTFDVTIINIGQSLSGTRVGATSKLDWSSNFVTPDAGAALQNSTSANPSIFYTEKPNKGADRYWTVAVDACGLPLSGSISYDMLCMPETGGQYSYNTHENNAPYLMYANASGWETLFAHNHGTYGFTSEPKYAAGLPKGLYKLSIRYWDQKGVGLYPAVRTAAGSQLAYAEYWFRIQSQSGIGTGAAREGVSENTEAPFVTMGQNPVTRTLSLTINGAKGQEVKLNLVDAAGRSIKVSSVTPETNTHREEIDMTSQHTGMYFIQVSTPSKRAALKVLKVSQE